MDRVSPQLRQTQNRLQSAGPVRPVVPHTPPRPQKKPVWKWVVLAGIPVVLVCAMLLWWYGSQAMPRSDRYQAVFLDNGQTFFGKLQSVNGQYLRLENAYYTKKQDIPANATPEQKSAIANNIALTQMGDEIYGPESSMMIRSDQVLFWQDLKADSKVAKAIESDSN